MSDFYAWEELAWRIVIGVSIVIGVVVAGSIALILFDIFRK